MKTILKLAIAAAAIFTLTGVARAEGIECPLGQATRAITDPLPAGWWTTPIVSTLSETKLMTIGSKPALMCIYGPSGSIQRDAPAAQTCVARAGGFDCVAKLALPPIIKPGALKPPIFSPINPGTFKTGALSVPQTYTFDLDTGAVGGSAGVDLWFEADTVDLLYLVPRSGASMWTGDRSNRNYAGCAAGAHYTTDRISLADLPVGSYVCVKTSEGRISQFRVNALTGTSPKTLQIGYTTWNK
jgi:hypothetical protein